MRAELDFHLPDGRRWAHRFEAPDCLYEADRLEDVIPTLVKAREAAERGAWVLGFVAYEASPAFDPTFAVKPERRGPLALFAVFREVRPIAGGVQPGPFELSHWLSPTSHEHFEKGMAAIHEDIRNGVYYQANYSRRLFAHFEGDGLGFFRALHHTQPGAFSLYLDWGRGEMASVSPELFFHWQPLRRALSTRPMKGTAPRAPKPSEDLACREGLRQDPKERAENVMIVDLLRNDLGRLAVPGSVLVQRLFDVEALPTVWQMTSTIDATAREGTVLEDIFQALFPCGSVTGAPKGTAMQAIARYEEGPRGIYCGAMGAIAPGGEALFNVAIRSVQIDRDHSQAICGIGSGVTWSSSSDGEWLEWQAKRRFLWKATANFSLLETLRLAHGHYLDLSLHLERLESAARYFGFPLDRTLVEEALQEKSSSHSEGLHRIRMTLDRHGDVLIECQALTGPVGDLSLESTAPPQKIKLADRPFEEDIDFVRYKTTHRPQYDAFVTEEGSFDTLLWNPRGELTECTRGNIALKIDGVWFTPPLSSGLLPGIRRQHLLSLGAMQEGLIYRADLDRAERVVFLNSLRGCIPVRVLS